MPTTSVALPTASYGPATDLALSAVSVPTGITDVNMAFDRTLMTSPTLLIAWTVELSFDAGATWILIAGATAEGGVISTRNDKLTGLPIIATVSSIQAGLQDPENPDRQVRGFISLNEAVITQVTITLLP